MKSPLTAYRLPLSAFRFLICSLLSWLFPFRDLVAWRSIVTAGIEQATRSSFPVRLIRNSQFELRNRRLS